MNLRLIEKMPQRQYSRIAGRRHESGDYFPFLHGFSSRAGDDFSELVWENGQVTVQGQSSRVSTASFVNGLPTGVQSEAIEGPKDGALHDMFTAIPSSELDLNLNNELAAWLNYPLDDGMEQDYGSQRLPEVSVAMEHGLSVQDGWELGLTNLDSGEKGPLFSYKPDLLWPSQNRQTSGFSGSGVSDSISNQIEFVLENQDQGRDVYSDCRHRRSNSKVVNFPQISKQTAANLQDPVGIPASGESNSKNCDTGFHVSSVPEVAPNSMQELSKQVLNMDLPKQSAIESEKLQVQGSEYLETQICGGEAPAELNVACSSVDSGHGAEILSSDQTNPCKRKSCHAGDSGSHSDDDDIVYVTEKKHAPPRRGTTGSKRSEVVEVDTDHVEGKKPAPPRRGTTGSKRNRVAEVHNLSERRRRDRINEKMKALQELIPNCNKADKASMLGEAIEYLKMLQFQVQVISMRGGLCMQPVMYPPGVQPMYPHLAPFPPMGVGISTGRAPIFPGTVPQVPHLTSLVSGPANMFTVPGPVYGHPCQPPQSSEERSQPLPINSDKQPSAPTVFIPLNPNTKISS